MALDLEVLEPATCPCWNKKPVYFGPDCILRPLVLESHPSHEKRDAERQGLIFSSSGMKADGRDQGELQLLSQQRSQEHRLEIKTI